ncbi:translation initiation factor [Hahella sp. CCB-MM4]|uniref:translation initiation factor Sui1 n=1 Tax=Hahella sp. (strain CCB-MM4) TaxID=1926491 RepID=UPI000B9BE98B|nr:translation initiation factor Sui1 [Hahella sp. CCB-MM4]OZG74819.1 translation initiation factor [Hahella sp. CCB-MM4]
MGVEDSPAEAESGVVYSTSQGRTCPDCGQPVVACTCKAPQAAPGDGRVRVSRETKGRKGKGVTLITGIPLAGEELKSLAKNLKQKCGVGGTIKDGVIEIQGDHRDLLVQELIKQGYDAKKSGG